MQRHGLPEYIEMVARVTELLARTIEDDVVVVTQVQQNGSIRTTFGPEEQATLTWDPASAAYVDARVAIADHEAAYIVLGYLTARGIEVAILD